MLQMSVKVVGLDQMSMVPVVVLVDDDEQQYVPIIIGPAEANAIAVTLEGIEIARPLTHDLLWSTIQSLGAQVEKIIISDIVEEVYYAQIVLKKDGKQVEIDARPSDAIALAVRTDAAIYVSENVLAQVSIAKPTHDPEMEEFRNFLANLSPDDFRKYNDD